MESLATGGVAVAPSPRAIGFRGDGYCADDLLCTCAVLCGLLVGKKKKLGCPFFL
jgi:hypothetical protein